MFEIWNRRSAEGVEEVAVIMQCRVRIFRGYSSTYVRTLNSICLNSYSPAFFHSLPRPFPFCMFAPSLFYRTSCLLYDYIPTPHAQVNCQPLQKLFAKFPSHVDTVILWEHGGGMKLWQADAPANPPIHMPNNCRPYFTLSPLPFCNLLYFIAMYPIVTYPPVWNTKATA